MSSWRRQKKDETMWQITCPTSASISFVIAIRRCHLEGNRQLAEQLSVVNQDLGRGPMKIWDPLRRGADISFVAPYTDALGMAAHERRSHANETLNWTRWHWRLRAAILMYRLSGRQSGVNRSSLTTVYDRNGLVLELMSPLYVGS